MVDGWFCLVDNNRGMKPIRLSDEDPGHGRRETVREARECEYLKYLKFSM